jgi:hypothetical protein
MDSPEVAGLNPGEEGLAERGRHVDADPGRIARDQRQNGDGGEVGQHGQPLARELHAFGLQAGTAASDAATK